MTHTFQLVLQPDFDSDHAWDILQRSGCQVLYVSEEEGISELILKTSQTVNDLLKHPFIQSCIPFELPEMDYAAEWEKHALNFVEDKVQVNVPGGETIFLMPGAGFGDLSHPTTRLCLELMQGYVKEKTVIDIGTGSGVLALAALAEGAKNAIGIDIDPQALRHARQNAALNHLDEKVLFCLPEDPIELPPTAVIVMMNMITSEQEIAWKSFIANRKVFGTLILSGILAEQKEAYLFFAKNFGWSIIKVVEQEGWLGMIATVHK